MFHSRGIDRSSLNPSSSSYVKLISTLFDIHVGTNKLDTNGIMYGISYLKLHENYTSYIVIRT